MKIITIGHRGVWGHEPENTLLSVERALSYDIDFIEIDVAVCKTGEIIAIHDATLDRTTNGTGFVSDKTLEELQMLDAGKGQKIPLLQAVLDLIDKKKKINIEIKGEGSAQLVMGIVNQYVSNRGWQYKDFLISSFNHHELNVLHALSPDIMIGAVVAGIPIDYAACATRLHAYSIHLSKEFVNKAFVDDAHRRGIKVFVYTINDAVYFEKMKVFGIDGIFTDFPDRFEN